MKSSLKQVTITIYHCGHICIDPHSGIGPAWIPSAYFQCCECKGNSYAECISHKVNHEPGPK